MDGLNECAAAFALGFVEQLLRGAVFFHLALVQEHDVRRNIARKAHLVRDENHGTAFFGDAADDAQDFAHQLWIDCL